MKQIFTLNNIKKTQRKKNKMTTTEKSLGTLRLQIQIGFTNIADIIRSRSIDLGFELNVLVVGRRGLGTSTMVNSLFGAPIISKTRSNEITVTKNEIIENGISLETTIITFHESDIDPVLEYVDLQYYDYYENEQSIFGTYRGGGRNLSGGGNNEMVIVGVKGRIMRVVI